MPIFYCKQGLRFERKSEKKVNTFYTLNLLLLVITLYTGLPLIESKNLPLVTRNFPEFFFNP